MYKQKTDYNDHFKFTNNVHDFTNTSGRFINLEKSRNFVKIYKYQEKLSLCENICFHSANKTDSLPNRQYLSE